MNSLVSSIKSIAIDIEPELKEIQHSLHQIPETGDNVPKTHDFLVSQLKMIDGIEVQEHRSTGYGIIATLNGRKPGLCVLLRADIDALPIEENNDLSWKSTHPGKMHACGHDGHATWILGAAKILSQVKHECSGTVKFIFQPGEEVGKCAHEFIEQDKVLENPNVSAAFAAHNWPTIPSGRIGIPRHFAFGCVGTFNIEIKGKGGHASWPQFTVDPIAIVREVLKGWDNLSEMKYASLDHVLSTTYIIGGDEQVSNIIPNTAKFGGTFRIASQQDIDSFAIDIEKILKEVTTRYNAKYTGDIIVHKGNVENDKDLLPLAFNAVQEVIGENNVFLIEKDNLGGENFSAFSQKVPSVYIYIGNNETDDGSAAWLHDSRFKFDDNILANASAVFANLAINALSPR